ncbi:MAG: DUF4364 family protein [Clostridia bacterium]|nr:DUF4364 family protein [Clostridia bacterium]
MDNDAFSMGVAPGGLKDRADIKLMVCYLLKNLNKSLTRTQINEILQKHGIANYFEINGAVSDLVSTGQVTSELTDDDELITITAKTELSVALIERDLPRSLREKAINAAVGVLQRDRIKKESRVTVEPCNEGYHVTFTVTDMGTQLLKITVYVADERQIEIVKRNFYDNAVNIYSDVIASLTVE